MTRTDIHAPAAEGFDPEAYSFEDVFDFGSEEFAAEEHRRHHAVVAQLKAEGYTRAFPERGSSQCGHCGVHIRYAALLTHEASKEYIYVGETCLGGRFSGTKAQFRQLRAAAAAAAKRSREIGKAKAQFEDNMAAGIKADPIFAMMEDIAVTEGSSFLFDVRSKMHNYPMSEKQIAAVVKTLTKKAEWMAKREAEKADDRPALSGKQTIKGTVLSIKAEENPYSYYGATVYKMVVRDERGFKVWSTVPAAIIEAHDAEAEEGENRFLELLKGRTVQFNATLEVSDRDETFAFAKRPSKATLFPAS